MKRVFAALLVASLVLFVAASASDKPSSINGWVSETGCGAKASHTQAGAEACVKKCIAGGAKMAFVNDTELAFAPGFTGI